MLALGGARARATCSLGVLVEQKHVVAVDHPLSVRDS